MNLKAVRKSCVSNRNIKKGDVIKKSDISFKRPGTGISPFLISKIANKKAKKFIHKDKILKIKNFN